MTLVQAAIALREAQRKYMVARLAPLTKENDAEREAAGRAVALAAADLDVAIAVSQEADRRFGQPHYGHDERADTATAPTFTPFPKIGRLSRNCTITEKIDGTNAQIHIRPIDGTFVHGFDTQTSFGYVRAGSRNRWISPQSDNFGFARWVWEHAHEFETLGLGQHFGEWWGSGIQRAYGLVNGEKRFSLFNTGRWNNNPRPACCGVVPVLYDGVFTQTAVDNALAELRTAGSSAVLGFMKPEGIVVYHHATKTLFKKTLEKDEEPKGNG